MYLYRVSDLTYCSSPVCYDATQHPLPVIHRVTKAFGISVHEDVKEQTLKSSTGVCCCSAFGTGGSHGKAIGTQSENWVNRVDRVRLALNIRARS